MNAPTLPAGVPGQPTDVAAAILTELLREADAGRQSKDPMSGRRATLLRLREACDNLEAHRQAISGAAIESYLEGAYGKGTGPKAQSIANEKGRPLGMWHYLQQRRCEQKGLRPRNGRKPITKVIDEIGDPDQRDRLRNLQAESELNARKVRRAQSLFSQIAPGVNFDKVLEAWKVGDGPISLPTPRGSFIGVDNLKALEKAISALTDPLILDRCGLRYDGKRVERKGGTGEALLGLGVVSGLISLYDELTGSCSAGPDVSRGP